MSKGRGEGEVHSAGGGPSCGQQPRLLSGLNISDRLCASVSPFGNSRKQPSDSHLDMEAEEGQKSTFSGLLSA